jgi:hypothetical protein
LLDRHAIESLDEMMVQFFAAVAKFSIPASLRQKVRIFNTVRKSRWFVSEW